MYFIFSTFLKLHYIYINFSFPGHFGIKSRDLSMLDLFNFSAKEAFHAYF